MLTLAVAGLLAAAGCQSPTAPTPDPMPPEASAPVELIAYGGSVFEPHRGNDLGGGWPDDGGVPIPGALVTIVGGKPDGWMAVTDTEGRYAFEDYPKCELHSAECRSRRFRVEKAGYETQEVGASDPYRYGGRHGIFSTSEKHVAMSREWPADPRIQRMLRELPALQPLWLVERPEYMFGGSFSGSGVIVVRSVDDLHVVAHEYCHAHQTWSGQREGLFGGGRDWPRSAEGRAFVAAWDADQRSNDLFLDYVQIRGYRGGSRVISEEFAEICAHWFVEDPPAWPGFAPGPVGREYFRVHLPHLHAFSEEWLRWRNWGRRP